MEKTKKETILQFKLTVDRTDLDLMERFFPNGTQAVNRTEWRGKEPRSCAVTKFHGHMNREGPTVYDVEVTYRPKGWISYVGDTKYDGWTAMVLDRAKDGTLLDGHGNPLPLGAEPVYVPFEVYPDVDFNELQFGEFIGERESVGVPHVSFAEMMEQVEANATINTSMDSQFFAPRRQREDVRLIITDLKLAPVSRHRPMRTFLLSRSAPQFHHELLNYLHEILAGYIEGRFNLKNIDSEDIHFVELAGCVMELTGPPGDLKSSFDVLDSLISTEDMDAIARHIKAIYAVEVSVVEGERTGFLLRRTGKRSG
jgi:hypothetical protein